MFAYIDNHSELTQSMVNQYNDSLIFLGDEKQIFVPLINAYVGIGTTAYENLLSRIGESNNNLDEYNKYIHNDTVTSIYAQFSPAELESIRTSSAGGSNHVINVRGIDISNSAQSDTVFKANRNIVLKGFNDYGLVGGKDDLGRTVNTSYTSGINVTITHNSDIRTGFYNFNGKQYSYAYYDPYDVITIDDTKTWAYIKSSNSYMTHFVTKFASEQANRVYKNILGIADSGGNVFIEKEFDEAFNYSDVTNEIVLFQDVFVKMGSDGHYELVTVENRPADPTNNDPGGFAIKVNNQIIYTNDPTKQSSKLSNDQLKALLAGEGNNGIYGGYVIVNGDVIPVWYHRDNSSTASSYINIVDGIQTLREVAYILDQITDGTSDDGINLAYNISSNYIEIEKLKEWKNQIGNETVSSFKSESGTELLTVNYYSANLWDKDRDDDDASIGKVKLDLDLRLAQTYQINGVTYAAYLQNHNVPDEYKTYFIFTGDTTDVSNYKKLNDGNNQQIHDLLKQQDPSLEGNSTPTIGTYAFIYDPNDNTKIIGAEHKGNVTLDQINNSNDNLNEKYIYFPYRLANYEFRKGLTNVEWVTTYVGWACEDLVERLSGVNDAVMTYITQKIDELDYPDTDKSTQGQFVTKVDEIDGKISVTRKKLPLDTILKNDVFYTHDVYLHISTEDAKKSDYSGHIYKLENGEYTQITNVSSLTADLYDNYYFKTSLANMTPVSANTSVNEMILNGGNVSYFAKQTTHHGTRVEYLPIDIHSAYTSGTLFTNDKVTAGDTIYYWLGNTHNSKYFDISTIHRTNGSTTTLFTSYITYLAASSENNTGLADAWDVRRTIESMFQWVNIKTNKIIS